MALVGIGIGIHAHILQMSVFSENHSTIQDTKRCLSYSSSTFPRNHRGNVFRRTRNDKNYTSFSSLKALFSLHIAIQQNFINDFRGRRIGAKSQIFEILQKIF